MATRICILVSSRPVATVAESPAAIRAAQKAARAYAHDLPKRQVRIQRISLTNKGLPAHVVAVRRNRAWVESLLAQD